MHFQPESRLSAVDMTFQFQALARVLRKVHHGQRYLLTMLHADLSCRDLRPSTVKNYCRQVEPLLERFDDVASLSRDEIIEWIHECSTKSKQRFHQARSSRRAVHLNAVCRVAPTRETGFSAVWL